MNRFAGGSSCKAAETYRASLPSRFRVEAANLAALTGWSDGEIERRMSKTGQPLRDKN